MNFEDLPFYEFDQDTATLQGFSVFGKALLEDALKLSLIEGKLRELKTQVNDEILKKLSLLSLIYIKQSDFSYKLDDTGYFSIGPIIIQWGTVLIQNGHGFIKFPKTFKRKCFSCIASDTGKGTHVIAISPISTTEAEVWSFDPQNSQIPSATRLAWLAIGA
jgi:hypothetical protein